MKRLSTIILISYLLTGCSSAPEIDPSRPAPQEAARLAESSPTEAAEALIGWLKKADASDRDYARLLTRELMSIYDSDSLGRALRFVRSLDSIKATLSPEDLAHIYVMSAKPWRLGAMMRDDGADQALVKAVEEEYAADAESLEAFRHGYDGEL